MFSKAVIFVGLGLGLIQAQTTTALPTGRYIRYADKTGCGPPCSVITGDTRYFSAWAAASTVAGPFNGGAVFGTFNDGTSPLGQSLAIGVTKITAFDISNVQNTNLVGSGTTSAYGTSGQVGLGYACASCGPGSVGQDWSSGSPWFKGGKLYLPVHIQYNPGGQTQSATLLVSPDPASFPSNHWCNPHTYATGGTGGAFSCDSGNWSATGDLPGSGDTAAMLWPGSSPTDSTNTMGRVAPMQIKQEGATAPSIPGLDTTCDYFLSHDGNITAAYMSRVCSNLDPMKLASWEYLASTTPTWTSTITSRVALVDSSTTNPYGVLRASLPYSAIWTGREFLWMSKLVDTPTVNTLSMSTSKLPWGPFTNTDSGLIPKPPSPSVGFPTLMLSTLTTVTASRSKVILATNGLEANYTLYFVEFDLQPSYPSGVADKSCTSNRWALSKNLIPGALVSNGLAALVDYQDTCNRYLGAWGSLINVVGNYWSGTGTFSSQGMNATSVSEPSNDTPFLGAALSGQNGWTIGSWFYNQSGAGDANNTIQPQWTVASSYGEFGWNGGIYGPVTASNRVYFRWYTNSGSCGGYHGLMQTTATITTSGGWHYIWLVHPAGTTVNSGNVTMYVDGAKVATTTAANCGADLPATSTGVATGVQGGGTMALTLVYNRALTPVELGVYKTPPHMGVCKVVSDHMAAPPRLITFPACP